MKRRFNDNQIRTFIKTDTTTVLRLMDTRLLASDLLDAVETIREMRKILKDCDSNILDDTSNRVQAILESTKEYE